ncbi:hypothetical protein BDB01DRAFT_728797, partial [Pilobolus umbonatus]
VCSYIDSPTFMLNCIQHGAADYLIKPLTMDNVKTLFLNVTRYHPHRHIESTQCHPQGKVWLRYKDKLKGVYNPRHHDRIEYLRTKICQWDFLPIDLDTKDLIQVVYLIIQQILMAHDSLSSLRVSSDELYHFIFDTCHSYHSSNPYHNFRHAVDVLQANYYFLFQLGLIDPMVTQTRKKRPCHVHALFEPMDIFALLLASLGHDVGHPGASTGSPLAELYNDKSILENFHAMSFFHILQDHCFSQLTECRYNPHYSRVRKIIVNCILATDMSMHDDYVQRIKDQADRFKRNQVDLNDKDVCEREKILFCSALIKCADISNCARPFNSARRWAHILAEELFDQGDLERELGLEVAAVNERGKIELDDFQIGFKQCIALKLFEGVTEVTPGKK